MTSGGEAESIRTILVALDNSPSSVASLELAARLATLHGAELHGLFVEDENLSRVAALPVSRHLTMPGPIGSVRGSSGAAAADERPATGEVLFPDLDVAFRAQASRAQGMLRRVAESARLTWSFRSVRGEVKREVLAAAAAADLVAVGRRGWGLSGQNRIGSTVRELLAKGVGSLLLLSRPEDARLPLAVLWEDSPAGLHALRLSATLSRRWGQRMTVVVARSAGDNEALEVAAALAADSIEADVEMVPGDAAGSVDLGRLARPRRILVLPIGGRRFPSEDLCLRFEGFELSTLCVRLRTSKTVATAIEAAV